MSFSSCLLSSLVDFILMNDYNLVECSLLFPCVLAMFLARVFGGGGGAGEKLVFVSIYAWHLAVQLQMTVSTGP